MYQILTTIREKLIVTGEVNQVSLFNNQFEALDNGDENVLNFPVVLVEFIDIVYDDNAKGTQTGDCAVRLYLGLWNLVENEEAIFVLRQKVHEVINTITPPGCTAFSRRREGQDTNHGNVIVWTMDYLGKYQENSAYTERNYIQVTPTMTINKKGAQ